MRFANWLHNGQPTGAEDAITTENGAYAINGATSNAALAAVTRTGSARWWLPSEDEWYKAAYYNPNSSSYYDYPTYNSTLPDNNLPSADTGNSANIYSGGYTTGNPNYPLTDAGAYTFSASPYGTFDQGGEVSEWNDTRLSVSFRGIRGGSWFSDNAAVHASGWSSDLPAIEYNDVGFRVAMGTIPEPSTLILLLSGSAAVFNCWVYRLRNR
jgi:sulfatase modifying factor 1